MVPKKLSSASPESMRAESPWSKERWARKNKSAFVRTAQLMNIAPDARVWGQRSSMIAIPRSPFTGETIMIRDKLGRPGSNFQPAQRSKSFCAGHSLNRAAKATKNRFDRGEAGREGHHGPSASPGLRK
eukprot:1291526-Pyramimonas_sp.AAC.1